MQTVPKRSLCGPVLIAALIFLHNSTVLAEPANGPVYQSFPSPNGRFALRLREGHALGNCSYDRAQLLDNRSGRVLCELKGTNGDDSEGAGGAGGGFGWFDDPPAFWSLDSRYVAVMCHDHRTSEIDVVQCRNGRVRACKMPEVIVPRIENEFDAGRQWHTFLKPKRWATGDLLVADYSGTIRNYQKMPQRADSEGQLGYKYRVSIKFNASMIGKVISVKRLHFERFYVP
jgi:hypothetical protein